VHWADPRAAWLWSADGSTLLWRNDAARLFGAKLKKSGLKLAPDAEPIKGQVHRLLRLGSPGRSSLSRIQFLAGGRPVSTTCTVTPLELADGSLGALIVAVDPIEPDILAAAEEMEAPSAPGLLPDGADYLLVAADGRVTAGSPRALELYALTIESQGVPEADAATMEIAEQAVTFTRFKASPAGDQLLVIEREGGEPPPSIDEVRAEEGAASFEPTPVAPETIVPDEPLLPLGLTPLEEPAPSSDPIDDDEPWVTEPLTSSGEKLSSLFDRLAGHEALYSELTPEDEHFVPAPERIVSPPVIEAEIVPEPAEPEPTVEPEPIIEPGAIPEVAAPEPVMPEPAPSEPEVELEAAPEPSEPAAIAPIAEEPAPDTPPRAPEPDVIAAVIEFEDDLVADHSLPVTHRVTGRGFMPIIAIGTPPQDIEPLPSPEPTTRPPTPDTVDRVSRYNFDELSRLLADRVGGGEPRTPPGQVELDPPIEPARTAPAPTAVAEGALINIAAETFILNRLPLGILVFRDQQVLFANRALTDLVGYETIDGLRAAGIGAIFPSDNAADAGPVTHLVRRDGSRFPVTARLQSITWQGRPALMLSASPAILQQSHETAVRSFAELASGASGDGYVQMDRQGVLVSISPAAQAALGGTRELEGSPLAAFVHPDDLSAFRAFLEKPARFAETVRPSVVLRGTTDGTSIVLFAEGQAGIVAGYFGFVRTAPAVPAPVAAPPPAPGPDDDDIDPSMLARVTRGVRRPLNTIIGFADLIRSAAFGAIENNRYLEYARDIKTAGQEISVLVDELDDYARLRAGKYATRPADIDLVSLLESCLVRVRGQANAARVLLRNGISETLPHVRGDRASLGQAVLNLLASAIDQTPAGGSVVVSAQVEDDGHVLVNIRDSGEINVDPGERFVVFRDGVGKDGETLAPVRSSVGLALTRALVSVNSCTLDVSPAGNVGTLFSIGIPADLVAAKVSA
jgi:PAS domain-containing protein